MKITIVIDDKTLRLEAELACGDDADAFAQAYNEARGRLWPLAPDKPPPPRRIVNIPAGSRAAQALDALRAGVTDPAGIAGRLGVTTGVAAMLKAGLIAGGHWKAGRGAP